MELVDIGDSKSPALKSVPVRVRPLVPNTKPCLERGGVFCLASAVGEIGTPVRLIAHAIWTRSKAKALAQQVLIAPRLLTSLIVRIDDLDATTWQGETPSARDGASHSGLFQIAVKLKITPNQRGGVFCLASAVGETGTPVRLIAPAIWTRNEVKAPAQQVLIAPRLLTSFRPLVPNIL